MSDVFKQGLFDFAETQNNSSSDDPFKNLLFDCGVIVIPTSGTPAGWTQDFNGVANANISKINGVAIANISKVNGI